MPASIVEIVDTPSRQRGYNGEKSTAERTWLVVDETDDQAAMSLAEGTAPTTFHGLTRYSQRCEPYGGAGNMWKCTFGYKTLDPNRTTPQETGTTRLSFDISMTTEKITHSLETVHRCSVNGGPDDTDDFKQAIGVTGSGAEMEVAGVDILRPEFTFDLTKCTPAADITDSYLSDLAYVAYNPVNDSTFRGQAAGTVLFMGCSGSPRGQGDDYEITFRFAAKPNLTGIEVGDIQAFDKEGWDYVWIRNSKKVENGREIVFPYSAHVERIYTRSDFSLLGVE